MSVANGLTAAFLSAVVVANNTAPRRRAKKPVLERTTPASPTHGGGFV